MRKIPKIGDVLFSVLLIFSFLSIFISFKTYLSFCQQGIMTYDFNNRRFNLADDEFIENIITDLPNISATVIPLKAFKAFYLRDTKKENDSAKSYFLKAIKDNPYIKISEAELSRMYFDESAIDSAIYYGKNAFYGLPNNPIHFGHYAAALSLKADTIEIKNAFSKITINDYLINKVYLIAMTSFIDKESNKNITEAIQYANVNDDEFKVSYYILMHGRKNVNQAIKLAKEGDSLFNKNMFNNSAKKYIEAIKYNPSEPAFYQNAGNAFLQLSDHKIADYYLLKSIDSLNDQTGKSEYLYGISLLEQKNNEKACNYINLSFKKYNYKEARYLYNRFCN